MSKEKKSYTLDNINQMVIGDTLEVFDKDKGETKTVKIADRAEICSIIAYMIGIEMEHWDGFYSHNYSAILVKLQKNTDATIIRYLSRIRTVFMNNFKEIDSDLLNLINIDRSEKFNRTEINKLLFWQVPVIITNARASEYVAHINKLIGKYIDKCKVLFPKSIKYAYIRNIFVTPDKPDIYKEEYNTYKGNKNKYPYQCYIHWTPRDGGFILGDDKLFLTSLYNQNNDTFFESYKLKSASESSKHMIYDFIGKSHKIVFFVDCENSDPYKLCKFFNDLDSNQIKLIDRVVLYDDRHTTDTWEYIKDYVSIPVEYNLIERVSEHKSLVDHKMIIGITKASLQDNVDSFVICSSDSDFWAVMDDVDGNYLVLYEDTKCSENIRTLWNEHGVMNFSLDDFYNGTGDKLKEEMLLRILINKAPEMFGSSPMDFTKQVFRDAYIQATKEEITTFCNDYTRKLSIKINDNGLFYIGI